MMIAKVHGGFEKLSRKLVYDAADPSKSSIEATIDTATINTREPQRDAHLKSADFFTLKNSRH
jgi:polyisoprenoid-binding protein YceI